MVSGHLNIYQKVTEINFYVNR